MTVKYFQKETEQTKTKGYLTFINGSGVRDSIRSASTLRPPIIELHIFGGLQKSEKM